MSVVSDDRCSSRVVREVKTPGQFETHALAMLWREVYPAEEMNADRQARRVARLLERGGRAWILRCKSSVAGFASVTPTPGLVGLYELEGFIAPGLRRQGLGRQLFQSVVSDLAGSAARQLYCTLVSRNSADSPDSP
ncbi:MAG TPA: GNAT family N-acetyltransferase, partial [Anaerolineae bacterium]|nr:GNAT family N-acetyltransferase [Anaerolineae bacterium]